MNRPVIKNFWPPLYGGIGLGLTLLGMFLLSGHGLGAFGFFKRMGALVSDSIIPAWSQANDYFYPLLNGANPLDFWVSWEITGVALGALIASLMSRRFRIQIERGSKVSVRKRLLLAVVGGMMTGFGAALARGCTSGLGLSGGATLTVAGFLFLATFFLSGIFVSRWSRRYWS